MNSSQSFLVQACFLKLLLGVSPQKKAVHNIEDGGHRRSRAGTIHEVSNGCDRNCQVNFFTGKASFVESPFILLVQNKHQNGNVFSVVQFRSV